MLEPTSKSRSNYSIFGSVSEERFNEIFPKKPEKKEEEKKDKDEKEKLAN